MTGPQNTTAGSDGDAVNGRTPVSGARRVWHRVDAVVAYLLLIVLTIVNIGVGFALYLGAGLGSDCHGASCESSAAATRAVVIAAVLLVVSTVVGYAGMLHADARQRVLVWAPMAGIVLTCLAWAVLVSVG